MAEPQLKDGPEGAQADGNNVISISDAGKPKKKHGRPFREDIDWEGVEIAYRAGAQSIRAIGALFGISHTAVRKRAESSGWTRDIAVKVARRSEDLVSRDAVKQLHPTLVSDATEEEVVEANAAVQADVIRGERSLVVTGREVTERLLAELHGITVREDLIEQLVEAIGNDSPEGHAKRSEALTRILGLNGRTATLEKLVMSMAKVIETERKVFGIEDRSKPADAVAEALRALQNGA